MPRSHPGRFNAVMRWVLTVEQPTREVVSQTFALTANAWHAFEAVVASFQSAGFVADEVESVRYGEEWFQHLARGAAEVVIRLTCES